MPKEIEFEPAYIYPDDYRKPYLIERYKKHVFSLFQMRRVIERDVNIIYIGSDEWYQWIDTNDRFRYLSRKYISEYRSLLTTCLIQKERRGKYYYWYAYKWHTHGIPASRIYIGRLERLSAHQLIDKIQELERVADESRSAVLNERKRHAKARRRAYDKARRAAIKARKRAELDSARET